MKVIYKYKVEKLGENIIELPKGAKIVSFGEQVHEGAPMIFLWALVDQLVKENEMTTVAVLYTGVPVEDFIEEFNFSNTVQSVTGLVYHCFIKKGN